MNETLTDFFEMLEKCHGIWAWCLDEDWNTVYMSGPSETLRRSILLGRGRGKLIAEHFSEKTAPLIISDELGLLWAAVSSRGFAQSGVKYYVLGPVVPGNVSGEELRNMIAGCELDVKQTLAALENIKGMPRVTTMELLPHIIALNYYVRQEKCRLSDFSYLTPGETAALRPTEEPDSEERPVHSPRINEQRLFDMIRTGNLDYHEALTSAAAASPGIRSDNKDPLRQAKYSVVAFIALCSRAAMDGGLSSDLAYTLCDYYTDAADSCTSISRIASLSNTMYEDFIRRVNKCRRESGVSRPIRICCDYIDIHPTGELTLEKLAEQCSYAPYYLSRKFRQEMGITLRAYITRARIEHAKTLLKETELHVQEISDMLHFCSKSYFAEQFRKETGLSPNAYRNEITASVPEGNSPYK